MHVYPVTCPLGRNPAFIGINKANVSVCLPGPGAARARARALDRLARAPNAARRRCTGEGAHGRGDSRQGRNGASSRREPGFVVCFFHGNFCYFVMFYSPSAEKKNCRDGPPPTPLFFLIYSPTNTTQTPKPVCLALEFTPPLSPHSP